MMCGRYKVTETGDKIWEWFDIHGKPVKLTPHWNIAPTQNVAVVRKQHELEFLRWGITVPTRKPVVSMCAWRASALRSIATRSAGAGA